MQIDAQIGNRLAAGLNARPGFGILLSQLGSESFAGDDHRILADGAAHRLRAGGNDVHLHVGAVGHGVGGALEAQGVGPLVHAGEMAAVQVHIVLGRADDVVHGAMQGVAIHAHAHLFIPGAHGLKELAVEAEDAVLELVAHGFHVVCGHAVAAGQVAADAVAGAADLAQLQGGHVVGGAQADGNMLRTKVGQAEHAHRGKADAAGSTHLIFGHAGAQRLEHTHQHAGAAAACGLCGGDFLGGMHAQADAAVQAGHSLGEVDHVLAARHGADDLEHVVGNIKGVFGIGQAVFRIEILVADHAHAGAFLHAHVLQDFIQLFLFPAGLALQAEVAVVHAIHFIGNDEGIAHALVAHQYGGGSLRGNGQHTLLEAAIVAAEILDVAEMLTIAHDQGDIDLFLRHLFAQQTNAEEVILLAHGNLLHIVFLLGKQRQCVLDNCLFHSGTLLYLFLQVLYRMQ